MRRLNQHPLSAIFVSIVSFLEQALGANAYINRAGSTADVVDGFRLLSGRLAEYSVAQVLDFDAVAAQQFDQLRAQRIRLGTMDLRIASIALANNMRVVSRNLRDFQRVPGLTVEDWAA